MNAQAASSLLRFVSDYQGEAHYAVLRGPRCGSTVRVRPNRYQWDVSRFGAHWTSAYRRERKATEGGIIMADGSLPASLATLF